MSAAHPRRRPRRLARLPGAARRSRIVTLTVTEAGYVRGTDGGLDTERPDVQADMAALRGDPRAAVRTTPARLVAGLAARRAAGAGPLAVVSCDNLPDNGGRRAAGGQRLRGAARPDAGRLDRRATSRSSTTMVDRITPATTADDARSRSPSRPAGLTRRRW